MRPWLLALAGLLLAACAAGPRALPEPSRSTLPRATTGPFVVVAVDNHFHDVHPEEHRQVSADRPLVVRNEGHNLHNFTVVGTEVSVDLRPGEEVSWDRIGEVLPPGTYRIVCHYHADQGMTGEVTVTP
ncbi:MAG TPA: hypothetical protein VNO34_00765 [Actinomycetota bacterium]|nr:hypothetical protein [Actinomycetota bacterium]